MKAQGNTAFSSGDYAKAVEKFTEAISQEQGNHILYSNRSAAYCALKSYEEAIVDADKVISLNPVWSKGYSRKGAALQGAGRLEEAKLVFEDALKLDSNSPQLKKSLSEVESALQKGIPPAGGAGFFDQFNPFTKPGAMEKIIADPSMKEYLAQADFLPKLTQIAQNPSLLGQHLQDRRILQAVMVAMGVNVKATDSGEKSFSYQDDNFATASGRDNNATSGPVQEEKSQMGKNSNSKDSSSWEDIRKESSPKDANWREDTVRIESDKMKELGNLAYKSRQFEEALSHYDAAFEKDTSNISVLNNKAAVYFELGNYTDCIKTCEEAIEKGRELFADFKIIAKSYARMGSSYMKVNDFDNAIKYFNKSLTEHRTPDVLAKVKEAEKSKVQKEKEACYDPALADVARNTGNDLFKAGNFTEAMKYYNEAIKRNEKDPRNFSNRAACYSKLMAFPEAIKDCDIAITLDPTFIKAYTRKANIYLMMRKHQECLDVLTEAKSRDVEKKHTSEIEGLLMTCYNGMNQSAQSASQLSPEETMARAMSDPEISQIMNDPVMQQILQQMQSDPKALMEHMKNPMIASKIRKLISAGIIRTA